MISALTFSHVELAAERQANQPLIVDRPELLPNPNDRSICWQKSALGVARCVVLLYRT